MTRLVAAPTNCAKFLLTEITESTHGRGAHCRRGLAEAHLPNTYRELEGLSAVERAVELLAAEMHTHARPQRVWHTARELGRRR